jgi:hypothetical protein
MTLKLIPMICLFVFGVHLQETIAAPQTDMATASNDHLRLVLAHRRFKYRPEFPQALQEIEARAARDPEKNYLETISPSGCL